MKVHIAVAVTLLFCFVGHVAAQQSKKTMRSTGRVMAVSPDSVTIKPGNANLTFSIDTSTKVVGKGVGTKTEAMKAANKSPQVTDLVNEYDSVTVEYEDLGGGKLHAKRIDVRVKGTKQ